MIACADTASWSNKPKTWHITCCKIFALWLDIVHSGCVPTHNQCVLFSRGQYGPQMLKYLTGMVLRIYNHNNPSTHTPPKHLPSIIPVPILHQAKGELQPVSLQHGVDTSGWVRINMMFGQQMYLKCANSMRSLVRGGGMTVLNSLNCITLCHSNKYPMNFSWLIIYCLTCV